jgi:hypothetical protein
MLQRVSHFTESAATADGAAKAAASSKAGAIERRAEIMIVPPERI